MLPQGLQDCPRGSPMRVEVAWSPPNAPADAATDAQAPPKSLKRCGVAARSETRLLTRHLEEVWFPGHACHALVASLFASLFAGKREVPPRRGRREALARAGAPGAFYFSPPKAKIPADLATQGQKWHLFTTRDGFGLHPEATRLFVLHDLGPKPIKVATTTTCL